MPAHEGHRQIGHHDQSEWRDQLTESIQQRDDRIEGGGAKVDKPRYPKLSLNINCMTPKPAVTEPPITATRLSSRWRCTVAPSYPSRRCAAGARLHAVAGPRGFCPLPRLDVPVPWLRQARDALRPRPHDPIRRWRSHARIQPQMPLPPSSFDENVLGLARPATTR